MNYSKLITVTSILLIISLFFMLKGYKDVTEATILTLHNMKNHCEYKSESKCILTFIEKE